MPDARGRPKVKVVYVVLEAQYQSSLAAAVKNINAARPQVAAVRHHPKPLLLCMACLQQAPP